MGRTYDAIDERLAAWLEEQPVFFVATAPVADGCVNCSPKGNRDEFRVLGDRSVAYLDQTGSGIETIAHLRDNGRIVVMFCAFAGPPRIVRLHGRGRVMLRGDRGFPDVAASFPHADEAGVRAVIAIDVERIADSCGYGVPLMRFEAHRPTLDEWAARKGPAGVEAYWASQNRSSIDGLPGVTGPTS